MIRQFKTTTDLDRWYCVETLNLIAQLETRAITENNYIYCMVQLGKSYYRKQLHLSHDSIGEEMG